MAKQEELTRFYMSNTELKDSAGNVDKSALKDWNAQVRQMTLALESATNGLVKVIKTIDVNGNALATFDVKRSQAGNAQPAFGLPLESFGQSLEVPPSLQYERSADYQRDVPWLHISCRRMPHSAHLPPGHKRFP